MKKLLPLLFLLLPITVYSQNSNDPLRVELETAKDENDYNCLLAEEQGVVVFYEGNPIGVDSVAWILMHYDTNLKRVHSYRLPSPANLNYVKGCYLKGRIFILFQEKYQKKTTPKSYLFFLDLNRKETEIRSIDELSDLAINYMQAFGDQLVMISFEKELYNIYRYDFSRHQLTKPQLTDGRILSIEFCEADTLYQKLYWGLIVANANKSSNMQLIETTYRGDVIRKTPFPSYTGYYLNSSRFAVTDTAQAIIIGTYTDDHQRYTDNHYTGVYTLTFKNGVFGDPNYFTYAHIKSRDSSKVTKNRRDEQNLHELIGPIFINNGNYTFVSEVFYPEYAQQNTPTFDPYYRYNNTYATAVFNGYRYVNAYIITFDKNGELLWDNYMPFSGILTDRLTQRVSIYPFEDWTIIFYPFNNRITYTLLAGYDVIEPLHTTPLVSNYRKDIIEYSRNNYFVHWYGNYFIAYGYQYIRNNSREVKNKRYVFYMNKLGFK